MVIVHSEFGGIVLLVQGVKREKVSGVSCVRCSCIDLLRYQHVSLNI